MDAILGIAVILFALWFLGKAAEFLAGFSEFVIQLIEWYEKEPASCLFTVFLFVGCSLSYFIGSLLTKNDDSNPLLVGSVIVFPIILVIGLLVHTRNERLKAEKLERKQDLVRAVQISDIDDMGGLEFERYIGTLLTSRGFDVSLTPGSADFGVDLVAKKENQCWAVQCKRRKSPVSLKAVQEVVTGKEHYGADTAVVITNNYFTHSAVQLAQSTDCKLVDRNELANWINVFQSREKGQNGG